VYRRMQKKPSTRGTMDRRTTGSDMGAQNEEVRMHGDGTTGGRKT